MITALYKSTYLLTHLLTYLLSYCYALSTSGLDRLDYHCEMIMQSLFREIKHPTHPLHTFYLLQKYPKVKWFCDLHIPISFHFVDYSLEMHR